MKKTVLRLVSGVLIAVVLAGGSVAVAAADKPDKQPPQKTEQPADKTTGPGNSQKPAVTPPPAATDKTLPTVVNKPQTTAGVQPVSIDTITARALLMKNRNNVVAFLDKAVAAKKITQGDENKILKDWDAAHPEWILNVSQLGDRVMAMKNHDKVVALLDKLVAGGRLNQGDANKILKDWEAAHANMPSPIDQLKARVMEMKNRNNVETLLDKMIAANRITQGDANKILKDWDAAHPGWILNVSQLHDRVMTMKNHDNVVALLDKLVAGGRLNQGDANKILKDWEAAHANPPPAAATPKRTK